MTAPKWYNSRMMRAARCESTDTTPVWLMRQAGRYMQEYRRVREKTSFLEMCRNPDLCSEVMITAVERLGVDAAIIFSDLLPILIPMGMQLEYQAGEGPVIHNALKRTGVDTLHELEDPLELGYVYETVRKTRRFLREDLPVIGFAGSPFTLASYAIEGGGSHAYSATKKLMYEDPGAWNAIMSRLTRAVSQYLLEQIRAGAQIVQLFDSWVGCLSVSDYRKYVMPYSSEVISTLKRTAPETPVIHFGTGNPMQLPSMREAGGDIIGVDWRISLDAAWELIGYDRGIQGNLDPAVLLTSPAVIRREVQRVLGEAQGRAGHIFNLGHGVLQQTPVENAVALVEMVHELGAAL